MKRLISLLLILKTVFCVAQDKSNQLPVWRQENESQKADWLVQNLTQQAAVYRSGDGKILSFQTFKGANSPAKWLSRSGWQFRPFAFLKWIPKCELHT